MALRFVVFASLVFSTMALAIVAWDSTYRKVPGSNMPISVDKLLSQDLTTGQDVYVWGVVIEDNGVLFLYKNKEFSEFKNEIFTPISIWVSEDSFDERCLGDYVAVRGKLRPTLYGPGVDSVVFVSSLQEGVTCKTDGEINEVYPSWSREAQNHS